MVYRVQSPPPVLARFVGLFWYYNGYQTSHAKERLLPDGAVELVINLRENAVRLYNNEDFSLSHSLPGAVLCGPQSRYFVIDTDEQDHVLGVHFKAGGAFPFFKMPASEFRDQHVPLEFLWG